MTKNRQFIIPAVALGVLLIVLAVVYFALTASDLPSFLPGHQAGSTTHHFKHGLAALLLGLAAFVFAWFQTGPASARGGTSPRVS